LLEIFSLIVVILFPQAIVCIRDLRIHLIEVLVLRPS
jgi:hypothetical protein